MSLENFKTSDDKFRLSEIIHKMANNHIYIDGYSTNFTVWYYQSIIKNVLDGLPFGGVVWAEEDSIGTKSVLFQQTYFYILREFYYNELTIDGVGYLDLTPKQQSRFDDTMFTFRTIWHHPDLNIAEIKGKIEMRTITYIDYSGLREVERELTIADLLHGYIYYSSTNKKEATAKVLAAIIEKLPFTDQEIMELVGMGDEVLKTNN